MEPLRSLPTIDSHRPHPIRSAPGAGIRVCRGNPTCRLGRVATLDTLDLWPCIGLDGKTMPCADHASGSTQRTDDARLAIALKAARASLPPLSLRFLRLLSSSSGRMASSSDGSEADKGTRLAGGLGWLPGVPFPSPRDRGAGFESWSLSQQKQCEQRQVELLAAFPAPPAPSEKSSRQLPVDIVTPEEYLIARVDARLDMFSST